MTVPLVTRTIIFALNILSTVLLYLLRTMHRFAPFLWLFCLGVGAILCFDGAMAAYAESDLQHLPPEQAIQLHLRKKKRRFFRREPVPLAKMLFPGVAPEVYHTQERVFILTELVTSKQTNVPFEFYDLPGCPLPPQLSLHLQPGKKKRYQRKNLGARLLGVDWKPSPHTLHVGHNLGCTPACASSTTTTGSNPILQPIFLEWHQVKSLRKLIDRQYRVHLSLDQLPVVMKSGNGQVAVRGYPVGFKAPPSYTGLTHTEYYLYNHLKFVITVHRLPRDDAETVETFHITGFEVIPVSMEHALDGSTCAPIGDVPPEEEDEEGDDDKDSLVTGLINDPNTYLALRLKQSSPLLPVIYSYEVEWRESELEWSDRWDIYLMGSPDDDIHFFAIVNSFMIVLFLSGAIATILIRTLRKDISAYNEMALEGAVGELEETGWKLVHGDVFRPPSSRPMLLSVLVGTGAQLATAIFSTMLTAVLKLVNPIRKGQTLTAIVVLYVLSGSVSGYVSARLHKFCDGKAWKMNTLLTATLLPGLLVGVFTLLNICLSVARAATAVSIWLLLAIFFLWVGVSAPLVLVGAYWGYRADKLAVPVRTNHIARLIPPQPWYSTPPVSLLLGGILPFGSVCIELFFIMSALWLHQIYYVMGFLLVVWLILAATCAQVSMVMNYLQLCAEDHRWWWKSFGNCASAGLYLFLYSLWFLVSRLNLVGLLPVVIYLTYMFLISLCFGLFCGSIGFGCAFWFNRQIYGALKVD
jgi:transmembrane 9 superfamily member 2/4